ncbi:hypothetical protein EDC04DRAFT_2602799 [Pisolithus marmoratus]|nr:hypothetical protein EDC04DRAFT_2602799 [Pisolithus marmoratus]
MPQKTQAHCSCKPSHRLTHSPPPAHHSLQLHNKMVGRGVAPKGKVPSMVSSSEHPQLHAMWTQADVKMPLDYVEENQPKAAIQPNGHHKTAKNCHNKWETIVGGSGLAYSSEKGANVVTEAGQLVMDELLEVYIFQPFHTLSLDAIQEMVKDAMANFNQNSNETISRMLAVLGDASKDQKLNDVFVMMYELEKDLLEDNFCHLHMLFEENPSFITGYRDTATHSNSLRFSSHQFLYFKKSNFIVLHICMN